IAVGGKERTEVARLARALVHAEQRRSGAARAALETEEHEHRVAAGRIVDIAPVGVADRVDAILSAAVAGVRQTKALRAVRRGKREGAALRHERLDLSRRQARPQSVAAGRFDESAGRLRAR